MSDRDFVSPVNPALTTRPARDPYPPPPAVALVVNAAIRRSIAAVRRFKRTVGE